jgi:hypothetical protein
VDVVWVLSPVYGRDASTGGWKCHARSIRR